ncbi:MAG: hypothetical protein ACXW3Z_09920 [Limisphaerales bacterium]
MSKTLSLLAIILLAAGTGCVNTVSGGKKAGVPLVKDTIESRYQRPVGQIFTAARQVLELNGTLTGENTINASLEAQVDNRGVFVRVDEVEPGVSRVQVQARKKGGGADIDLAAEIDKQIALKLASGAAR